MLPKILKDMLDFLVVGVLFKMIVLHWVADRITDLLTRTELGMITWLHFKNKGAGIGHKAKDPFVCTDGECQKV